MDISAWIDLGYFLFKDRGSVDGATGCRDTGYEDLGTVGLKDFLDTTPVSYLHGCYGGTDGDGIETKKTMAEDDRVLG